MKADHNNDTIWLSEKIKFICMAFLNDMAKASSPFEFFCGQQEMIYIDDLSST